MYNVKFISSNKKKKTWSLLLEISIDNKSNIWIWTLKNLNNSNVSISVFSLLQTTFSSPLFPLLPLHTLWNNKKTSSMENNSNTTTTTNNNKGGEEISIIQQKQNKVMKRNSNGGYPIGQGFFRAVSAMATFAAALLMALNQETHTIDGFPMHASYHSSPAFRYI